MFRNMTNRYFYSRRDAEPTPAQRLTCVSSVPPSPRSAIGPSRTGGCTWTTPWVSLIHRLEQINNRAISDLAADKIVVLDIEENSPEEELEREKGVQSLSRQLQQRAATLRAEGQV